MALLKAFERVAVATAAADDTEPGVAPPPSPSPPLEEQGGGNEPAIEYLNDAEHALQRAGMYLGDTGFVPSELMYLLGTTQDFNELPLFDRASEATRTACVPLPRCDSSPLIKDKDDDGKGDGNGDDAVDKGEDAVLAGIAETQDRSTALRAGWSRGPLIPGLRQVVQEIVSNARDLMFSTTDCSRLEVSLDADADTITVRNNGPGVPVVKTKIEFRDPEGRLSGCEMWEPELAFAVFRAGSNLNDTRLRITGGCHGMGAKLAAVMSRTFTVRTVDAKHAFEQTYKDNLRQRSAPTVRRRRVGESTGTTIAFQPDWDALRVPPTFVKHNKGTPLHNPWVRADLRTMVWETAAASRSLLPPTRRVHFLFGGNRVPVANVVALGDLMTRDGLAAPAAAPTGTFANTRRVALSWPSDGGNRDDPNDGGTHVPLRELTSVAVLAADVSLHVADARKKEPRSPFVGFVNSIPCHGGQHEKFVWDSLARSVYRGLAVNQRKALQKLCARGSSTAAGAASRRGGGRRRGRASGGRRGTGTALKSTATRTAATGAVSWAQLRAKIVQLLKKHAHVTASLTVVNPRFDGQIKSALLTLPQMWGWGCANLSLPYRPEFSLRGGGSTAAGIATETEEDDAADRDADDVVSLDGDDEDEDDRDTDAENETVSTSTKKGKTHAKKKRGANTTASARRVGWWERALNRLVGTSRAPSGVLSAIIDALEDKISKMEAQRWILVEKQRQHEMLASEDGRTHTYNRQKRIVYDKLTDATYAGDPKRSSECVLICSEGDSAAATLSHAITDPDRFGSFVWTGVPLNVTNSAPEKVADNRPMTAFFTALNLSSELDYSTPQAQRTLRYGYVAIAADMDHDGHHIACLLIANINKRNKTLLKARPDYVLLLATPILVAFVPPRHPAVRYVDELVRDSRLSVAGKGLLGGGAATGRANSKGGDEGGSLDGEASVPPEDAASRARRGKAKGRAAGAKGKPAGPGWRGVKQLLAQTRCQRARATDVAYPEDVPASYVALEFFSLPAAEQAGVLAPQSRHGRVFIEYKKGLGSHDSETARNWLEKYLMQLEITGGEDVRLMEQIVSDDSDGRKQLLRAYDPATMQVQYDHYRYHGMRIPLQAYLNDVVVFHAAKLWREVPSIDGLKAAQRKLVYMLLTMPRGMLRVAQIAGRVVEHLQYHHGDASLHAMTTQLGQDYPGGPAPVRYLATRGQFGSRRKEKTAGSPRYIFAGPSKLLFALFPAGVLSVLARAEEDGAVVEPATLSPVLPVSLLNGDKGIGSGWSTDILPCDPFELLRTALDVANFLDRHNDVVEPLLRCANQCLDTRRAIDTRQAVAADDDGTVECVGLPSEEGPTLATEFAMLLTGASGDGTLRLPDVYCAELLALDVPFYDAWWGDVAVAESRPPAAAASATKRARGEEPAPEDASVVNVAVRPTGPALSQWRLYGVVVLLDYFPEDVVAAVDTDRTARPRLPSTYAWACRGAHPAVRLHPAKPIDPAYDDATTRPPKRVVRFQICEVPPGVWVSAVLAALDKLPWVLARYAVRVDLDVCIEVHADAAKLLRLWTAHIDAAGRPVRVLEALHLTKAVTSTNMHCHDGDGQLQYYPTAGSLFLDHAWLHLRTCRAAIVYERRRVRAKLARLRNKLAYITLQRQGKFDLGKLADEQAADRVLRDTHGLQPARDPVQPCRAVARMEKVDVVGNGAKAAAADKTATDTAAEKNVLFSDLYSMPTRAILNANYRKLQEEVAGLEAEAEGWDALTPAALWRRQLAAFYVQLDNYQTEKYAKFEYTWQRPGVCEDLDEPCRAGDQVALAALPPWMGRQQRPATRTRSPETIATAYGPLTFGTPAGGKWIPPSLKNACLLKRRPSLRSATSAKAAARRLVAQGTKRRREEAAAATNETANEAAPSARTPPRPATTTSSFPGGKKTSPITAFFRPSPSSSRPAKGEKDPLIV